MTDKTKRQLRAEAVERLKRMDGWCDESKAAADFMKALLWDLRVIDGEHVRDALVDLLTDDEPPEGVCGTEPAESVRQADLTDTDCGQNADMSGNAPGCARNDAFMSENGVSDGAEGSDDTREALEADIDGIIVAALRNLQASIYSCVEQGMDVLSFSDSEFIEFEHEEYVGEYVDLIKAVLDRQAAITEREAFMRGRASLDDEFADLQAQVDQLRGDLKGARKSRDHWRRVASKHGAEIRKLKAQLEDAREYGAIWPRFEDGELVRFGDMFVHPTGDRGTIDSVRFLENGFQLNGWCNLHDYGAPVKRPPLMAADGEPIEVGQVLYGESDGKAWTVDRIDHGQHHPVLAHCGRVRRGLRAGWLTHEPPDSLEDVASTVRTWLDIEPDERSVTVMRYALENLVERIEKLGGGR